MGNRSIADAIVNQVRNNVSYPSADRLLKHTHYPNEDVYEYELVFLHGATNSYAYFLLFVSLDGERLLKYTITDRLMNSYPSLSDDILMDHFSTRDDRQIYYRNLFYVAVKP